MKRIVVLNFFPAFSPPTSGGEARYFFIYQKVSQFFDVTLISHSHPGAGTTIIEHHSHFRELRVGKEDLYLDLHQQMQNEGTGPECSGLVCAMAGQGYQTEYGKTCQQLFRTADCVIHESPYTLPFDSDFFKENRPPRIYNSYNVESLLIRQILAGPNAERHHRWIAELEGKLVHGADLVFATSDQDTEDFKKLFGLDSSKLRFVPNGYEPDFMPRIQRPTTERKHRQRALFIGSGNHPPNVEAARFIVETLAPDVPNLHFDVIGSVCGQLNTSDLPSNVTLHGFISDRAKKDLISISSFGLNPMTAGGGTNLKMIEYLASALVVVTTELGARGLGITNNLHAIVKSTDQFASTLTMLATSPLLCSDVASAGQRLVETKFTWSAAALVVKTSLENVCKLTSEKNVHGQPIKLLVLNDFPVSDGYGGGQVRIKEIYRALPDHYQVTLLCLSNENIERVVRIDHRFAQISIPKTLQHLKEDNDSSASGEASIGDIISARHCRLNERFCDLLNQHLVEADIVIFEHPFLSNLLGLIPNNKPVIYSSLNVEVEIKGDILRGRPDFEYVLDEVRQLENQLVNRANLITAVSESDAQVFRNDAPNSKVIVLLNGVDLFPQLFLHRFDKFKARFEGLPVATFLGSSHTPNVDAACFIVESLAPQLVKVIFLIVGSVCDAIRHKRLPPNILLAGVVSSQEKQVLQSLTDVMINPMNRGGGSSLKVADALGSGVCLLTTPFGARGFDVYDTVQIRTAELSDFADTLQILLNDQPQKVAIASGARKYAVENLDWTVISKRYDSELSKLCIESNEYTLEPKRKSLLVVTHRYTIPPRGGAEVYLDQILARLGTNRSWTITVVTIDSTNIDNVGQFSALYSNDQTQLGLAVPPYIDRLYRFPVQATDGLTNRDNCRALAELWSKESVLLGNEAYADLGDLVVTPVLLGGWYPAEGDAQSCMRWTGGEAALLIPAKCDEPFVRIKGYSPAAKLVSLEMNGVEQKVFNLGLGTFDLHILLNPAIQQVIVLKTATTFIKDDARALGLLVTEVIFATGKMLPKNTDVLDLWRVCRTAKWVDALLRTTVKRDPIKDGLFSLTRGPNAPTLERWLRSNTPSYDVILAHELPFGLAPLAVNVGNELGVPTVLLPHLHVEDRFYHWQSYIKAFRQASLTLVSPGPTKSLYFDNIEGAKTVVIRGGAIAIEEFNCDVKIAHYRSAFQKVYSPRRPFILVLGRKSSAKRYQIGIEAMQQVSKQGLDAELVMIGIDEDSVPISQPNVRYLGMQPREVVLGALFECVGLMNMSQSESFGIVVLEAWMANKPVAVNEHSLAFKELVQHGVNGCLCSNADDLARAFSLMIMDPVAAAAMGSSGKILASTYTWDNLANDFDALLKNAIIDKTY